MSEEIIRFNTNDSADPNRMMHVQLFDLVPETDPVLKEVLPEFDFKNPPTDPVLLASRLVETCKHHRGVSLSANQCGFKHRVFVMGAGDEYVAFFNPVLVKTEDESHIEEGCLSWPLLTLRITRPKKIWVEYQDFTGAKKEAIFDGISARCFLHELDHMNGIMYTSRVKPLALQFGLKKLEKIRRKYFNPKMMKQMTNGNQKAHT